MTVTTRAKSEVAERIEGHAPVNGLQMHYAINGRGKPAVYIHAAWSHGGVHAALTGNRRWIAPDLQGHGRTPDIDRPLSFEQSADDIAALLKHLGVVEADLLGESFGGVIALYIALRHPDLVRRVVAYGAPWNSEGYPEHLLGQFIALSAGDDAVRFQRDNYRAVAPDPARWPVLFEKVHKNRWNGFSREELQSIRAPVLLASGDRDWLRLEHLLEMFRLIPNAQLAVIPDAGHFLLYSEPERLLPVVAAFLDGSDTREPLATPSTGYQPGATR